MEMSRECVPKMYNQWIQIETNIQIRKTKTNEQPLGAFVKLFEETRAQIS